ncbi:hypothetical protein D3C87_1962280 [compost metagenome]
MFDCLTVIGKQRADAVAACGTCQVDVEKIALHDLTQTIRRLTKNTRAASGMVVVARLFALCA